MDIMQTNRLDTLIVTLHGGSIPSFKELYGTNDDVLKFQYKRYINLLKKFKTSFKTTGVELFSSPGRTEIGGNHTDHNYGRVLAGAVNLDNIAAASRNHSNLIRVESTGFESFNVNLNDLGPIEEEKFTSAAIVRGISARMKELGYSIGGFDAVIDGCVPKGSGLSSSASFEVLIGTIISHLFNDGALDPVQNAIIGQYAENNFFGKPCGLMDQTACSVGGLVAIDFENPVNPVVSKVDFDFTSTGFTLVITDTGGSHAQLNDEYASIPVEMKSIARELGAQVLRQVKPEDLIKSIPKIREKVGDRALLRAYHFFGENQRVLKQVEALEKNDFRAFLGMIIDSGHSSYMYNQNIYSMSDVKSQGVALALALSEMALDGRGAWRVHGGGFAGTIQAFVPDDLVEKYVNTLEPVFGNGSCHKLFIRPKGSIKIEI